MSLISTEKRNLRNKLEGFILIKSFWAKILPCKKKKTFFIRIEFRKILNEDNIVQGQINTKNFSFNPKENVLENLTLTWIHSFVTLKKVIVGKNYLTNCHITQHKKVQLIHSNKSHDKEATIICLISIWFRFVC